MPHLKHQSKPPTPTPRYFVKAFEEEKGQTTLFFSGQWSHWQEMSLIVQVVPQDKQTSSSDLKGNLSIFQNISDIFKF